MATLDKTKRILARQNPQLTASLILAAQSFLDRICDITTEDFSKGGDRPERKHLEYLLDQFFDRGESRK